MLCKFPLYLDKALFLKYDAGYLQGINRIKNIAN